MLKRLSLFAFFVFIFPLAMLRAQDVPLLHVADHHVGEMALDTVAFSPDGRMIASGGRDKLVRLWDAATRANIALLAGHSDWVTDVAFNADGSLLVSGGQDNSVRVWDTRTYAQTLSVQPHSGTVTGVAFSPDGRIIASGSLDETLWLGDARTGETIANLPNYGGPVWGVAFSPDGHRLVSGSEDGVIWVWGLYENSIQALRGHSAPVTALAFNADGTQLASASWDGTIRLWDMAAGTALAVLNEHSGPVMSVAFSQQDSDFALISAGLDGAVYLWGADSRLLAVLRGAESSLGGAALSHDSRALASARINGGLELWDMNGRVHDLLNPPAAEEPLALPVFTPPPAPTQPPTLIQQLPAPTQVAAAAAPSTGGSALSIPTANIYSPVKTFYLDGVSWAIDAWEQQVGHLQGTAWLGSPGNIALGGHSRLPDGRPGIFAGLYGVKIGDPVFLGDRRYVVSEILEVNYQDLRVVYPTTSERLTLITCDVPSFDPETNLYYERLVVIALPG